MAEKGFGVKEVNLIGASGTPTITSPNNLNLNANNVAISTNVSIGGTLSVTGNVSVGGTLTYEDVTNIDSVGIVTARAGVVVGDTSNTTFRVHRIQGASATNCGLALNSGGSLNLFTDSSGAGTSRISISNTGNIQFGTIGSIQFLLEDYVTHAGDTNTQYGFDGADSYVVKTGGSTRLAVNNSGANVVGALTVNGSAISIDPTDSDIQVAYTVTANGSSAYRFAGNGVVSTADNPDLYLIRGQKYRFINNSGGSHPFQIRESSGGSAYSTGVTNNGAASGNIDFAPTFDSPSKLVYQCTSHGGMVGNIYMTGGVGRWIQQSIVTLQSGSSYEFTDIPADVNEVMIVFDGLSFDAGGNEIEFLLGHSGGYNTSNYIISASYEPGGNYQKRTSSIRFNGIGSASYVPTGRLHLWKPVHSANWWVEGICYPWETEGEYQHRVTGTAPSGGTLSKIKIQGSGGANFDNTGNGKIQLSYLRY